MFFLKASRAYSPLGHYQRWWWPSGEYALLGSNSSYLACFMHRLTLHLYVFPSNTE